MFFVVTISFALYLYIKNGLVIEKPVGNSSQRLQLQCQQRRKWSYHAEHCYESAMSILDTDHLRRMPTQALIIIILKIIVEIFIQVRPFQCQKALLAIRLLFRNKSTYSIAKIKEITSAKLQVHNNFIM